MYPRMIEVRDEVEATAVEQALAMARELKRLADAAPDGQVLAVIEQAAVEAGRRFTRDRLQDALNAQAAGLEQRGRARTCPCGGARRHQGRAERRLVTAAGDVTLRRVAFACRACSARVHPLDERLGVDGLVSPQAQRLLCLAGAEWSFERAARDLRELAGLVVCDHSVRKVCDRHGGAMRAWQRDAPEASRAFAEAEGDVEFQTDGTAVNTAEGWREMRLSIFVKRGRGEPVADLDAWDDQRLPAPEARVAAAGIRTGEALGPQWRRAAARLGIKDARALTVIADGAKWIWGQVERNLPGAAGVLDIYHASEHIHAAAAALHGEPAAAAAWAEGRRRTLLDSGAAGLVAELEAAGGVAAELAAYLAPHVGHTGYRRRLAEGRSIGSGLVEGACKTVVGRRLKQTGARWRVRRVERMASLCCVLYGGQWDAYWTKAVG